MCIPATNNGNWGDTIESFTSMRDNTTDHVIGARIEYYNHSQNEDFFVKLVVNVLCNREIDTIYAQNSTSITFDPDTKLVTVVETFTSNEGCPSLEASYYVRFFQKNKVAFSILLIVVGLFLTIGGVKFVKVVLFLFTTLAAIAIGLLFGNQFLPVSWGINNGFYLLIGFVVVGLILGILTLKFIKFGFFVGGAIGGGMLGMIIFEVGGYKILTSNYTLLLLVLACGLAGGLIVMWLQEPALILATASAGSYGIARGISGFAGGFPSEIEIVYQIKSGAYTSITPVAYAYIGAILLMAALSIWWQCKGTKKRKENTLLDD
jgi:hypothetical protein